MKRITFLWLTVLFCIILGGCQSQSVSAPDPKMIYKEGSVLYQSSEESGNQGSGETPSSYEEISLPGGQTSQSTSGSSAGGGVSSSSQPGQGSVPASASSAVPASASSSVPPSGAAEVPSGGGYTGDEYRAVWFSYLDLSGMIKGRSKSQFTNSIAAAFSEVADYGCNVVLVQVRPFADALYASSYFPWSYLCTGTEGSSPGYDPLAIMVSEAKKLGLEIEAWINPYRIRGSGSTVALASSNTAVKWENAGSDSVVRYGGGFYYNPARKDARDLIINGVKELVEGYEIDGVHFDDYFYPSPDDSFDAGAYSEYKAGGGTLSLASWRRENVNILVRDVYATIKKIDSSVRFGISPQANTNNNYNSQYIDVDVWLSNAGYIDYICPQVYFGFLNGSNPFEQTVATWNSKIKVSGIKLYIGLAAYKIGQSDTYAGTGKNEWIDGSEILARQVKAARGYKKYGGFAIYRYASLFGPDSSVKSQVEKERNALADLL